VSGGGSSRYDIDIPPAPAPAPEPTAAEVVEAEIASHLGEAERVVQLLGAFKNHSMGQLVVAALNVGQGDCCVMRLPNGDVVVVDCNVRSANVNVVRFLQEAGISRVALLVLTHPDHDHVSGLPALAASGIKFDNVIDGRFRKEDAQGTRTPGYEDYKAALRSLEASGTTLLPRTAISGDEFTLGGTRIEFLAPLRSMAAEDANEASLAFRLEHGQRSVLFGGDVTAATWEKVAERTGARLKSDIFWCSHHGAESGCHPPAVSLIKPHLTIISVGENNYGHPHSEALECYTSNSTHVRRTDDGTIGLVASQSGWKEII
jgi:competence protein ComEC